MKLLEVRGPLGFGTQAVVLSDAGWDNIDYWSIIDFFALKVDNMPKGR